MGETSQCGCGRALNILVLLESMTICVNNMLLNINEVEGEMDFFHSLFVCTCMCVSVRVWCVCMCVCVGICTYVYTCMYCMIVYMYVCLYAVPFDHCSCDG